MEIFDYPLICHCDGQLLEENGEVSYVGGRQCVVSGDTMCLLVEKICNGVGVEVLGTQLTIKMKYETSGSYNIAYLDNNSALHVLWVNVWENTGDYRENDEEEDVVGLSAPISEFNSINSLNDEQVNSWMTWESGSEYVKRGEFVVGQKFPDKTSVIEVVTNYNVDRNQTFWVPETTPHTITFKCGRKNNPCKWRLRATQQDSHLKTFTIVTYTGPHESSCVGDTIPRDHINIKRGFISNEIRKMIEVDWSIKVEVLVEFIKGKFGYTISYGKAWNAKQRAISNIFGGWEKSYEKLPKLMHAIQEINPGTVVKILSTPSEDPQVEMFMRIFWAFKPSIDGFEHCRSIITIDRTHLYEKFKGVLLTALGVDANNQIYPLAFAIVETENTDSWPWFMACIRAFVTKRSGLCVISNRHPGIMKAMSEVNSGWEEPFAYHRVCTRHLASNVNTRYKSRKVKNTFGCAASQRQLKIFIHHFNSLGELDIDARNYVANIGLEKWSTYHDGGYRYGILTSNMTEAFNAVLKGARFLPITALVKCIFYHVNGYFVERRQWAKSRLLTPFPFNDKITKAIEANRVKSGYHSVLKFDDDDGLFQVITGKGNRCVARGNHTHTVDLIEKTYTCSKLQIYKYPCSDVLAVCKFKSLCYRNFVDTCYTSEKHYASYQPKFWLLLDEDYWTPYVGPGIVVDESKRRGKGRPKSKRYRNEMDEKSKSKVKCGYANKWDITEELVLKEAQVA